MEQLRSVLFSHIKTVRFNDAFERPEMATDLMEYDLKNLNILHQRGKNPLPSMKIQCAYFLMSKVCLSRKNNLKFGRI